MTDSPATTASTPRIVAVDIDGTLTDSKKHILPFTRDEIARVVDSGAQLVIVTARAIEASLIIERKLGVPASHIAFGGATVHVRHGDTLELLHEQPFSRDDVATMLAAASGFDVHTGLYTAAEWHVSDMGVWGLREARNTSIWPTTIGAGAIARLPDDPVFKVMFRGDHDALACIKLTIDRELPDIFAHLTDHVLEITTARKHVALARLSAHLDIPLQQFIAFGDTAADIPMLEAAGVGVLMGNADPALTVAGHVERTLTNDEDGVGLSLRKHFPTTGAFEI